MLEQATSPRIAAAGLAALSALHCAWAAGSAWPARDRTELADVVVGRANGPFPSMPACLLVAGGLGAASGLLAVSPPPAQASLRAARHAVVGGLALRGVLGLAGRTDLVARGSTSARFRSLDRRLYSPVCLALALLAVPALRASRP